MLNSEPSARDYKNEAYAAFAEVTKALANPLRLELLDLLVQGPRTVESLARGAGRSVASTSQHLQVLRRGSLVETEAFGTFVEYRLAPGVAEIFAGLRRLAEARSPALRVAKEDYFAAAGAPETIEVAELRRRLAEGGVTLLDVRPAEEFAHGHIPGARSVPMDRLAEALASLPSEGLYVATCRGPTCVFAAEAVRRLRESGREAVRFEQSVADWVLDGGSLSRGAEA